MKHINVALFVVHKGCPNMCSFCNQRSISGFQKELTNQDVDDACKKALETLDEKEANNGEIAFFGGSFTMISRQSMISLLECAYKYVKKGFFKGIRISTRPDGINDDICTILKQYGVTSVELGAQSLNDTVLKLNDRGHTESDVFCAVKCLKKFGFEVGLQMMTGLYGSEDEDSIETAQKIIDMGADTVRIYPTVVLKDTKLCSLMQSNEFKPKGVEESVSLCAKLILMFENAGVKIIRVGLHSGGNVEDGFVGGCYHPAFKELCESKIYFDKALSTLKNCEKGEYILTVNSKEVSKMTGQKRNNLLLLENYGYNCKVEKSDEIKKYNVMVRKVK